MDFMSFRKAVATRFATLCSFPLYRTGVSGDEMWKTYLESFPEGTNPIFRKRREYDCSCCRQFIKSIGNCVAISSDGELHSIWDVKVEDEFQVVADAMSSVVKAHAIVNLFRTDSNTAGTDRTFEQMVDNLHTWNHFFVNIPQEFVMRRNMDTFLGERRTDKEMLARALTSITIEACDDVLELIANNALYRGSQYVESIGKFREELLDAKGKEIEKHAWMRSVVLPQSVSRIRNTAIGTLLVDISEGRELNAAVKSFEDKVAPYNYQRTTAVVSKRMIDDAKKKVEELGITSALERRVATLDDIFIDNLLFVDRSSPNVAFQDVFDTLGGEVKESIKKSSVVMPVEDFIMNVVPLAQKLEVAFENTHKNNLVALITAADPTAKQLFKWDNPFSWSYNGEFADSIKERVKAAGGNVSGDVCCRLAWFNYDDLDLHMVEPNYHLNFANRSFTSLNGGRLDVDMNAGMGNTREPVENIFYKNSRDMRDGTYTLFVHSFSKRENTNVGFEVEVDVFGKMYTFTYDKPMRRDERVEVAKIMRSAGNITVLPLLPHSERQQMVWGIKTQTFQQVRCMMLSPNCWGQNEIGQKHFFFMLDSCKSDMALRGFYNEFLRSELSTNRKVFEMVGSKMQVDEANNGLYGIGFTKGRNDTLVICVDGKQCYTVQF